MFHIFPRGSWIALAIFLGSTHGSAFAATAKTHTIAFGKWITVRCSTDCEIAAADKSSILKLRPLLIDGRVKDFTFGQTHDITDRLFTVRRAFRVNDSLPQESSSPPQWQWQLGGWLLVDRVSGHTSVLNLPDYDAIYSAVSWYRDYAAYCGLSDDGKMVYAIVAQINRRKPLVKNLVEELKIQNSQNKDIQNKDLPNKDLANETTIASSCPQPEWQRSPARVIFELGLTKKTFMVRGHAADLLIEEPEDEEASK
jgi:hypothetical protein